jgi:hypothetical protein
VNFLLLIVFVFVILAPVQRAAAATIFAGTPALITGLGGFTLTNGLVTAVSSIGLAAIIKWAWASFIRDGVDAFIYESNKRRRADHERYLRTEVFADDIRARGERDADVAEAKRLANEAVRVANEAVATVALIQLSQDEINEKLDRVIPVCDAFERVETNIGTAVGQLEDLTNAYSNLVGQLQTHGVTPWNGIGRRATDKR